MTDPVDISIFLQEKSEAFPLDGQIYSWTVIDIYSDSRSRISQNYFFKLISSARSLSAELPDRLSELIQKARSTGIDRTLRILRWHSNDP